MVFRHPAASTDESSSKRARSCNDSDRNEPGTKLLDGAFVKMMSSDVAAGKLAAASADKYMRALEKDMPQFNYGTHGASECLGILTASLAHQKIDIPPLMLIADANDWGKTGSRSSRDDWLAVFSLGQSGKYLGAILAYSLDGPDSDASDCEGFMDDRPNKESFSLQVVPLCVAAINTIWNAPSRRSILDDDVKDALSGAIGDAYESELVSIDFAAAGDGEVHVSKYDREAGETLVTDSGVSVSFDTIIAKAMVIMAAKHRRLKRLKKACSRKKGVPKNIIPLFHAVLSEHLHGDDDDEVGE
eukprot:TRINITY_DN80834_c0_g1_i1.p1 TRINITY_DN80834_c0_g1~~TRINITY_DN80834_c0_g1_i1.p1  ORF type:complete len:302 (+),score=39.96 TRINITY_DN80834_c0_g1_i1:95-1000(+)